MLVLDASPTYAGTTTVSAGALMFTSTYAAGAALDIADGAIALLGSSSATPYDVVLKTPSLNTHASGRLDLVDNKLIVTGGDLAAVQAMVRSGYDNGAGYGPGIVTSIPGSADWVGYAPAADVGLAGGTFGGVPVSAGDVLVGYTIPGDANLDGAVDFADLVRLAQNYNSSGRGWWEADFTYDGVTDFNDLVKLAQNYHAALPAEPISGAAPTFEADLARATTHVPEPGRAVGLIAGMIWMGRKSRRNR
jgi:hypothetical protein